MRKRLSFIWFILFPIAAGIIMRPILADAQNAPVTTAATVNNAVTNQPVTIPVTVTGFNNIGSVTLSLDYNTSQLQYISATHNPALAGPFNVGDNDLGNGIHRLVLSWFGSGVSLPDGSSIVEYTFTYLSGTATLDWFDMGPSCLYSDADANILNDIPTSEYYINGRVCGILPLPGAIIGLNALCQGQAAVSYSISPMPNVSGYSWSVPPGAVIISGTNTASILVDYSTNSSSGAVTVSGVNECGNGPASVLPVTVNDLPVANAGNDTTIGYSTSTQLHAASGGSGTYSYHWSPESLLVNPYLQNPQTVQLTTSTVFFLEVTNTATLCQSGDEISINISGGPLSVNPVSIPVSICRGQFAQLYANAGGGSGSYNYSWTSSPPGIPAWTSVLPNPVVSPDTVTEYALTVTDGYNSTSGNTGLIVYTLPTAHISGGGDICDDGSMVSMQIDLTGTPPWTIVYSDGYNATTLSGIMLSPYLLTTSMQGLYIVTAVSDQYCQGNISGTAIVNVSPVPEKPVISISGYLLSSDAVNGNQWYRNDTAIAGAESQFLLAVESGFYSDIVGLNGCYSDTSDVIEVLITGYADNLLNLINVYPNPFKNSCYLLVPSHLSSDLLINIYNSNGKLVRYSKVKDSEFHNSIKLNFNNLSPGIYILELNTGDGSRRIKLILH